MESIAMVESWAKTKESDTTQAINGLEEITINSKYTDQGVQIGPGLPCELKKGLTILLKENIDIFTWEVADMIGVPKQLVEHKLNEKA